MKAATPAPKHRLASSGWRAIALVNASRASPNCRRSIASVPLRAKAAASSSLPPSAAAETAPDTTINAIRNGSRRIIGDCARRAPRHAGANRWPFLPIETRSTCRRPQKSPQQMFTHPTPWGSLAGAATYPPCASFPRDARDFHHVRSAIDSMIIDPMPTGAVVPEIRQSEFPL